MTRHAPDRSQATIHIDHRMVMVNVQRRRPGYCWIWPVTDAGPSSRGLNGDRIRRRWEKTQWVELRDEEFERRLA